MCRVRSREFPPVAASAPDTRQWVRRLLARWDLEAGTHDVALLTSELVTNAVVHARTQLVVTVAVADGVLEIGVGDHDPRAPRIPINGDRPRGQIPAADRDSDLAWLPIGGLGLHLVDSIAAEWGVSSLRVGKQVWFRLAVAESWPHRTDCPCGSEDLTRTRLDSGTFAVAVAGPWDENGA